MWGASPFTVEGTSATNDWVPVYGYYADNFLHSQIIYPKGDLEEMDGKVIKSMTFHTTSSYTSVSWGSASFQIRLKLVDASTLSGYVDVSSDDPVFSGSLSVSDQQMVVTFTEDFIYDKSKNLLFDLQSTAKGSWSKVSFYGSTVTGASKAGYSGTSAAAVSSSSSGDNFRPKTTFAYAEPPTCPTPKLSMTGKEDTSASFSWTVGKNETQWQYCYKPGTTEPENSDWSSPTSATSTTISGLTASTEYTFYLHAYCSSEDQSIPASKTFTTDCEHAAIPANGLTFGFEGGSTSLPDCWTYKKVGTGFYDPNVSSNAGYDGSTYSLHFNGNGSSDKALVILPKFGTDIKNLKISFYYQQGNSSSNRPQLKVGYMTDPNDASTYHTLKAFTRTTSWTLCEADFANAAEGAHIVLCDSGGSYSSHTYIDNIKIETDQDCSKPATPTYSDLTENSVTVSWTANTNVTDYKYINVDRTANPTYDLDWENDATLVESATSVALSELVDGHNYEFYVMCACGTVASDACTYQPLSCPNVTGVTLSNKVWNSVTVNWTTSAAANCDVRYSVDGGANWTVAEENISATSKALDVTPGNTYTIQVKPSCSADAWVAAGETYTPTCPTPGALTLSEKTYNSVKVSWAAVAGVSKWNLQYSDNGTGWVVVNNITDLFYTISGMTTNSEYTIQLTAECSGGYSETSYTPVYDAPSSVLVSAKDLGGDASWAPVDGATRYEYIVVEKDAAEDWTSPATGTTTSAGIVHANPELSGLHAKTAYDFYVKAVFAGGTSVATKKSFTTTSHAPNTPIVADGDITSSSAIATWTLPAACQATQCQWICKLTSASAPAVDDAAWSTPSTEFTANISGLEAYTDYTVYVRAYYEDGIYSANASKTFKTDCGTVGLPLAKQTFSSSIPACWASSYTGNEWGYEYSGTYHSAYYSAQYLANTATTNSADLKTPTISVTDKATLTFWYRNYYYKSYVTYYATGEVLFDDGETETELWSIDHTSSSIVQKNIDLSEFNLVGKTGRFIFRGHGAGTSSYARIWIDDVEITINPVSAPTNLAAAPTADGADVTWDAEEGPYDLQYRVNGSSDAWMAVNGIATKTKTLTGLTLGTEYEVQVRAHASEHRISAWTTSQTFTPINCPVPTSLEATQITHNSATISWSGDAKALRYKKGSDDWSSETISPADESFDLSELVAESTYTVQVKADCEDGDNWSEELEFTTKCTPITITKVAPFEADFAGLTNEMPSCWDKSATTKPYVTGGELQFNGKDQTAILPKFSNATSTLMLKFNYKHSYSASYSGQIQVGYIDASGDFQTFGSALSGATSYTAAEINFDGVDDDEAKYIAIRLIHNNPSNISYADGFIKDVVVELAPTCYAPASIADAASITASGATLSWTASGKGETQYQWAVAEGSAAPAWVDDAAHKVTAPTTSVTLTGLNAQTDYTFYVRSYCNADDQSEEVSKAFTTKCAAIAAADMPFEETFSATLGACWKTYAASYYSIYVSSGELHATAPKTSGSESVVVMPAFEMALNQLVVSFDYKGSNGTVEVGYVTDLEDKTTFVAVGDAYTVASAYKQAVTAFVSLGAVTGNVALRFKGVGTDGSFTVDNLRVAYGTGIADNTDNSEALAGLLGQTVDFVVNRTFKRADYFNTLCLPFSLSEEELANSPFAGAELWTFKYASVVNDELQVRIQQETSIKAGRPYLILFGAGEDLVNPLFKNVTITATSGEHMNYENIAFIGTLAPVAFAADDANRLFLTANNLLAWANTNGNVRSFRAYFEITPSPHPSPIRRGMSARIVMKEEVATGIEDVQGSDVQSTKVLENNQVLIIRNGVKYNLQGQVVK